MSELRTRGGRRFLLPDGSERYLVDELLLTQLTARLGAVMVDPLKTTVVQDQRCMTTWVVRKGVEPANRGTEDPTSELLYSQFTDVLRL